jgi:hypothetical protein
MILSLRQRHRRMFAVIGCLLPVAFVVGIDARKPVPSLSQLPPALTAQEVESGSTIWERDDLFAKAAVNVRLNRTASGDFTITCTAKGDFAKPDLIVYWATGVATNVAALPDSAILLGAFSAGALRVPANVAVQEGALILFSLADQEIVAVSQPVRINAETK